MDHEGRFLEDCITHVRRCSPETIEARCRARDVWLPSLRPMRSQLNALCAAVTCEDGDVAAWLHEAAAAYRLDPETDFDPESPTGAAIIEAANRRLLAAAMR